MVIAKIWDNSGREDTNMISLMETYGWRFKFDQRDIEHGRITPAKFPNHSVKFCKGNKIADYTPLVIKNKLIGMWTVIELIDGHYKNKRIYTSLQTIAENE